MFIDEVYIKVIGGKGGDGSTSFRHEKYVEKGGPDGGNGGKGGSVIFKADAGLSTLIDLKYNKKIEAEKGKNGSGALRTGRDGEDVIVKVPVGTTVIDSETNYIIHDFVKDKEEAVIASGGKGGRGNASFKSNKFKAPTTSEYGSLGEERLVKCELKLLADIGLVGLPSVGKSSLISVISNVKPKIADYHFTTLTPNLGVVKLHNSSYVVADLPGIIKGASSGIGLGDKFLKHALRTKAIAYVIDMSGLENDPIDAFNTIRKEVKNYSEKLYNKPYVVVANKMDITSSIENLEKFRKEFKSTEVIPVSATSLMGIEELKLKFKDLINEVKEENLYNEEDFEDYVLYEFKSELPFSIKKENDHEFTLSGNALETLLKKTKFNSDEASLRFARKLKGMGVDDELKKMGAKDGDTIKILNHEFSYSSEE